MSNAVVALAAVVWLSVVGVVAFSFWLRAAPKRRKPVDELEAADSALRNRIVDLEDKFESYVKREAVRGMRARKDAAEMQPELPLALTKEQRLADVRRRWLIQQGRGGEVTHGTAQ